MDYLDSKRIVPDSEYFRLRYELYRYAYRTRKFQVIACTDDDALAFMLEYGDKLFPGVPVVFCGATEHLEKVAERRDLYTGIVDDSNLETNIALAVRLFPETRRLVFVHDSTTSGINQANDAMALKPRFPRLTFEFISNVGLDEIKKRVRALPSDAVLFPLAYTTEPSGEIHTFEEAAKAIASASKVPVIAFREYQLEDGVVGGYVVSGEDQGRAAARMIESIIEGGRPRDIPIIRDSSAHYIFDYKQVRRFGIPESKLPKGSRVINHPLGMMTEYRSTVLWAGFWFAVAAAVIALLLFHILRRQYVEESLRTSEERFRLLFEKSPDMVVVLKGDVFVAANPASRTTLGYDPQELVGKTPWDISPEVQPDGRLSSEKAAELIRTARSRPIIFDWLHTSKEGSLVECEVSLSTYTLRGEQYTQAIVRNVTESRRAAEEKRALERSLDEQKRLFYRETLLSVTDGKFLMCEQHECERLLLTASVKVGLADHSDLPVVRAEVRSYLAEQGVAGDELELFLIAVGEALTNAIKHAGGALVKAGMIDKKVWVAVIDQGKGIESLVLPHVVLERGFSTKPSLGLGYTIMMEAADRIMLSTGPEGTTLVLLLNLDKAEASIKDAPDNWDSL